MRRRGRRPGAGYREPGDGNSNAADHRTGHSSSGADEGGNTYKKYGLGRGRVLHIGEDRYGRGRRRGH